MDDGIVVGDKMTQTSSKDTLVAQGLIYEQSSNSLLFVEEHRYPSTWPREVSSENFSIVPLSDSRSVATHRNSTDSLLSPRTAVPQTIEVAMAGRENG